MKAQAFAACAALLIGNAAFAQFETTVQDGWVTWRVAAVDPAPAWCCFSWNMGRVTESACDLDRNSSGFGNHDEQVNDTGEIQLYAKFRDGEPTRIRALSPMCPVRSPVIVTDLGLVDGDQSIDWLGRYIGRSDKLSGNVLGAIAAHEGDRAIGVLVDTAENARSYEIREDAIFWMGNLRANETIAHLERYMFDDPSPDIREKAAFAVSQSDAPNKVELLVRQGREDRDPDVRGEAWFWLAETGAPEAEAAILYAMREDRDEDVREEAVFALSQLPGDRGVMALLGIVRDKGVERELREEALFWLADSESDLALAEIEKLLFSSK